jgi:hypothetical protein
MTMQSSGRRRGRPPKSAKVHSNAKENFSLEQFLGPCPLLHGEDEQGYQVLYDRFREEVEPHDLIDELYIRDVVDQTWEIQRLRKIRLGLMRNGQAQAVKQITDYDSSLSMDQRDLVRSKLKSSLDSALECLQKLGIALSDINARAFKNESGMLFQTDQSIIRLEMRRNYTLREIERRKAAFAKKIIQVVNAVEESGGSKTIPTPVLLAKEG